MKITIILLFSLYSSISFSQNKNSTIIYNYSFSFDDAFYSQLDQTRKKNFKEAENIANTLKPKLVFNDSLAIFYSEDIMEVENKMAIIIAKAFCKCNQPLVYNIHEKIIYSEATDNPFFECDQCVLYKPMDDNWELESESKLINNYLCYKATQKISYLIGKKELTNSVTAWYCPEIPYSIGPKGYGGLPGLIFELHEKEGSYGIESITFNNNETKIKIPDYKKLVLEKEYYNSISKKAKEIKKE